VRVAVVGLGYWGPNIVRNFHELPCGEVVVACDRRREALDAMRVRYPGLRTTTELDEALGDDVEAVAIATPVETHFALAAAALDAGKHVFVEKPLASSLEDAEALVTAADDAGLVLMPAHTFLYSPPVNVIRDLIRGGDLGDIYFISTSRVNLGIHQSDVSVVWDLAPHDFSILRYWLEQLPSTVSAASRSCVVPDLPDVAFIDLEFPSGALAHVEISWLAPAKMRRTTIVGSEKMVVYDDTSNEPVRIFDSGVIPHDPETFGEYRLTYRTGPIVSPQIAATEPLALEVEDFCAAVREPSNPRSSAEIALDVIRMIEAVNGSLAARGAPVPVAEPSPQRA
jgi:predicted dehydrogenase